MYIWETIIVAIIFFILALIFLIPSGRTLLRFTISGEIEKRSEKTTHTLWAFFIIGIILLIISIFSLYNLIF